MFRTCYVHHQKDLIVHALLCFSSIYANSLAGWRMCSSTSSQTYQYMYNKVFLMMNITCSKHVEDNKN